MLEQKIKEDIKEAMRAKDSVRLTTLRGLVSGFTNELVAKGIKPNESIPDEVAAAVIKRAVKQRKDSIEQFKKGNRNDLVEAEETELKIIEAYLPAQMSIEEVRPVVEAKKQELSIADKSKMGMLMGAVMKELKDRADGDTVKQAVEESFS